MGGPRSLSEDDIIDIANQEGLPGNELLALADKEDSYDNSTSSAGARGRFQLLPATFKSVHPTGNIDDPRDNAIAAARYYSQGRDKFGGPEGGAAQYYAGPSWQRKVATAPGAKYGTNPDGSGGISIEGYQDKFKQKLAQYTGERQTLEDHPATNPPQAQFLDANSTDYTGGSDYLNSSIAAVSLNVKDQAAKVVQSSQDLGASIKKNIDEQMKGLDEQGRLQAQIVLDTHSQQAKQAAEASAELTRLGINTSDLDNTIAQISTSMNIKYDEAQRLREHIREEQSVGFFDNPVRYFGNLLTLPATIRQHNAIVEDIASQKQYVDQATGIASTIHAVNAAKFTTVSLEGAQAAAELARDKAHNQALQLQDTKLRQDFQTQVTTLAALRAVQDEDERSAIRVTQQNIRKTQEQKAVEEAARVKTDNAAVAVAAQIIGMNIPDRKTLDKQPKAIKESVEKLMDSGLVGKDPLEAFNTLRTGNQDKMSPIVQQQYRFLQTTLGAALTVAKTDPTFTAKKPAEQSEFISQKMREQISLAVADPNHNLSTGKANPYKIADIDTMSQLPGIATSRLAALVTQFKKDFPTREITDSQLYALAKANIGPTKAYNDMTDAAKDLSKYYQAGINLNNAKVRFEAFGMPKQEDYQVRLPEGKVDMSSYQELMTTMLQEQRNRPFLSRARALGD